MLVHNCRYSFHRTLLCLESFLHLFFNVYSGFAFTAFVMILISSKLGNTGLHLAALSSEDSKAKAAFLLKQGANPSVKNDSFDTPAHFAAKSGNLETLRLLVEKGGLSGILMGYGEKTSGNRRSRPSSRTTRWPSRSRSVHSSHLVTLLLHFKMSNSALFRPGHSV